DGGFQPLRCVANTEAVVRSAIGSIRLRGPDETNIFLPYYKSIMHTFIDPGQDRDHLYQVDDNEVEHPVEREQRPASNRTRVWYGPIGSGDKLVKNSRKRNELRDKYNVIGLEMEAAGIMNCIPVGVIRGVSNYGD